MFDPGKSYSKEIEERIEQYKKELDNKDLTIERRIFIKRTIRELKQILSKNK